MPFADAAAHTHEHRHQNGTGFNKAQRLKRRDSKNDATARG